MATRLRIGILTFHRCINYGSYWQARCLVTGLQTRGHDAVLLDHYLEPADKAELACALQPLLPVTSSPQDSADYAAKVRNFEAAVSQLPLSQPFALDRPQDGGHYDLIVIGSDEVWNLAHPWYGGQATFFGAGLQAGRIISYAASFGNFGTPASLGRCWADRLLKFDAVSVRDENSVRLVECAGRSPSLVLDPCFQFPPEMKRLGRAPYLAIYGHSMPEWFAVETRRWARRRDYAMLSIGYRNDWADEQHLSAGPLEFAQLIGNAAAVATNFFHGCVFAVLADKPFACAVSPYRENKVKDLALRLGTASRLIGSADTADRIQGLLDRPLEARIFRELALWRRRSDDYLDEALG